MTNIWADPLSLIVLVVMALVASVTNGVVGYGFSTFFTPVSVLFVSNQVLNPVVVLVELAVNVTLLYRVRAYIPRTKRHASIVIVGLAPGVVLGTIALAVMSPTWVRLLLYATLLPFTVLQLFGIRRPIRREHRFLPLLGAGIGFLYSLTTISGPPLAAFWNNQNLGKNDFRATMAQVRVAEALLTTCTYLLVGAVAPSHALFNAQSLSWLSVLGPAVLVGVPTGVLVSRSMANQRFFHLVASLDSTIMTFGLLTAIEERNWITSEQQLILLLLAMLTLGALAARVLRNLPARALQEAAPVVAEGPIGGESAGAKRSYSDD